MPDRETLRQAVGRAVRQHRDDAGRRQEDVARQARDLGLKWSSSRVAALERGDKAIPAEELLLLPLILLLAGCDVRALSDLIPPGEELVELGPQTGVALDLLRLVVSGDLDLREIAPFGPALDTPDSRRVHEMMADLDLTQVGVGLDRWARQARRKIRAVGLDETQLTGDHTELIRGEARQDAEQTAARRFKIRADDLALIARGTWGRSLTAERDARMADRRADGQADRAVRGHITRELYRELQPMVDRWHGASGDDAEGA